PAAATDDERANLLKWARGIDVLDENGDGSITDARKSIGDPLHSEPQLIAYGGTDASPDISIFMSDNQGYLHAFNATDGTEQFAFIPQELLPNLNAFFTGSGGYVNRPYGMDGPITAWVNDANNNGRILNNGTPEAGEFVYLYAGMRRGGSNYYALDVTDRSKPLLKFAIKGGTGAYAELGQTWSRAIRAKIRIGGADKDVLIFSGGYDPDVDRGVDSAITESSRGRALFVADARTGALLWWASSNSGASVVVPEMKYSIPASPRAIDLDGDGRVDRIYLADTGGQVFRVVLGKDGDGIPSLSKASISRIAALAGTTAKSARRFYATPDIALITKGVGKPFLSVSLGSGFHEHPLAQVNDDRFYILRDPELDNESVCKTGDTDCTPLFIGGDSDLYDATANLAGSSDATATKKAKVDIAAKQGLYIRLTDSAGSLTGEKVMSDATTFEGQVLFTTYQPGAAAGNPCAAITGLSRLYQISVTDATPVQPLNQAPDTLNDGSLTLTREDRSRSLKQGGLPPNPTILFPAISSRIASDGSRKVCTGSACLPDQVLACVGAECFPPGIKIETVKTFWQDLEE
ncbi:MAG: pilus assembly protein, partial [Stenotrophobium sp.]